MNDNNNRIENASNPHQGPFPKVLCVCSAGLLRSPSIAFALSNPPFNCNTRAAGINIDYALVLVDEILLTWADTIVCADDEHEREINRLLKRFNLNKKVYSLKLPDKYATRSPELMQEIAAALTRVNFNIK